MVPSIIWLHLLYRFTKLKKTTTNNLITRIWHNNCHGNHSQRWGDKHFWNEKLINQLTVCNILELHKQWIKSKWNINGGCSTMKQTEVFEILIYKSDSLSSPSRRTLPHSPTSTRPSWNENKKWWNAHIAVMLLLQWPEPLSDVAGAGGTSWSQTPYRSRSDVSCSASLWASWSSLALPPSKLDLAPRTSCCIQNGVKKAQSVT